MSYRPRTCSHPMPPGQSNKAVPVQATQAQAAIKKVAEMPEKSSVGAMLLAMLIGWGSLALCILSLAFAGGII